jgi:hypothetical protein
MPVTARIARWFASASFARYMPHFSSTVIATGAPGTSGSEYIVSPKSMLKSLFSATIDWKACICPQNGVLWPGAATPVSSPVYANLIVCA